jgi:3-oxoacyl-[acyl-carrier-protein] synthase III
MELLNGEIIPKFPHIKINFAGTGGGIQVCLALFTQALREAGIKKQDIDPIIRKATASDKETMFQVISETVTVEEGE